MGQRGVGALRLRRGETPAPSTQNGQTSRSLWKEPCELNNFAGAEDTALCARFDVFFLRSSAQLLKKNLWLTQLGIAVIGLKRFWKSF
jgi:hypothetical protein